MKLRYIVLSGILLSIGIFAGIQSCLSVPKGAVAVPLDLKKYSGKWYEIARKDTRFEKELKNVTAEYIPNNDGSITVINSGQHIKTGKISSIRGKAKARKEGTGMLKVSFFGPFYAAYNVIAIDENYQNALVVGNNDGYLWLLSRNKMMDEATKKKFLEIAKQYNLETKDLIWVTQD